MEPEEEAVRLLAILVRRELGNQAETIRELDKTGFGPTRIADLIGTTPNTVNVTLAKQKRAAKKPTN